MSGRIKGRADTVIEEFAERVNKLARINLGASYTAKRADGRSYKKRIDTSGALRNSLDYILNTRGEDGRFQKGTIEFMMKDYGIWVDKGRGKSKGGGSGQLKKNIEKWIRKKPLRMRDLETGSFVQMTDARVKGLAFVIARRIHKHGIPATNFFTEPFNEELPKYSQLFAEAVGQDAAEAIGDRIDDKFKTK